MEPEEEKPKQKRGFALLTPERQREIASQGGVAAHKQGVAHQWTQKEAVAAGRKGGAMSQQRKKSQKLEENPPTPEE